MLQWYFISVLGQQFIAKCPCAVVSHPLGFKPGMELICHSPLNRSAAQSRLCRKHCRLNHIQTAQPDIQTHEGGSDHLVKRLHLPLTGGVTACVQKAPCISRIGAYNYRMSVID